METRKTNAFNRNNDPAFENKLQENLHSLDNSQLAAVASEGKNVLIKAPAGAGKTKSLIAAVANYRYENLADRICAITFTRAARAEMEQRLSEMGIFDVEVTTIHVWSRNLLEKLGRKFGFKVKILQEAEIKAILEFITQQYLRTSRVKSVNLGILYNYITNSKRMDITENYRRTLNLLEERYIIYKRQNGLYDFTDYPLYLYDILIAYGEEITDIDALFVDEFQDVDDIQFKIFEKVQAKKKFFIGDAWQCIYAFRGCDPEAFNKLKDGFDVFKLKYNYRSYQKIIDYATTVYQSLVDMVDGRGDNYIGQQDFCYSSPIICSRGQGGEVIVISPYEEGFWIGDNDEINECYSIHQIVYDFLKYNNPMILCRTNKQVKGLQELGWLNVDTIHQAKGLEYDNVIVIDSPIKEQEDLNVAYVAMTRARDRLMVIPYSVLEGFIRKYQVNPYDI